MYGISETLLKGQNMKQDNTFCLTHARYGKAFSAAVSADTITNYYIHQGQLAISTYDRRTTKTTETLTNLPKSLR